MRFAIVPRTMLLVAAFLGSIAAPAAAEEAKPFIRDVSIAYVGKLPHQMYVERWQPWERRHERPIVLFHGGSHTGSVHLTTPDGRKGWLPHLLQAGWEVYNVDWPGHGRSGLPPDFLTMSTQRVVDAGLALLEQTGPAVLLTHSRSGPVGWKIADTRPDLVAAIVAIAPGPPANLQEPPPPREGPLSTAKVDQRPAFPEDKVIWPTRDRADLYTKSDRFPRGAASAYHAYQVHSGPRALNERYNVEGAGLHISSPERLAPIPIVVIAGDMDARHPREVDEPLAKYVGGDFIWLPDVGLEGHGHMVMLEEGNLAVADVFLDWLKRQGL